jgi:predicted Zn-dependent protease
MQAQKARTKKSRERFLEITRTSDYLKTQDGIKRLREAGWWDSDDESDAIVHWQETDFRRLMKLYSVNPETGEHEIINVKIHDEETGKDEQGYMQIALCERPHLEYAVNYYTQRALYYQSEAHRLNRIMRKKCGHQKRLPFDDPRSS